MKPPSHPRPLLAAVLLACGALFLPPAARSAEDLIVADFEGSDYGGWVATGTAFGQAPARGALPGQMQVAGFEGRGLVNSFHGGDTSTGTLTSPAFTVQRRYLRFLIGGGKDPEKACLQLLVDGRVVRTATGPNDRPGGSETLAADAWELSEFQGQQARVRIVDDATGGWGHVNVDHLVQTDRRLPGVRTNATRAFSVAQRYLHLPIRNGGPKRKVTTRVDGQVQVRNDIELADGTPDWWAPMDVSAWQGRTVTLEVDRLPEDSLALSSIEASDILRDADDLYREPLRAQFHFSPRRGWNNDPNGLAFFNGEYHLFFQHNPYGWAWGNMHWGHAVSRDLVHWSELGDVLAPDRFGPMFSGSAVVDGANTSGLGTEGHPPLVLLYTAAGDPTVQCLASSTDGRTFTKFPGNPVVPQFTGGNRDPKVIWHEPSKRWVMVLYVERERRHTVHILTSPNLREWTHASTVEGIPGSNYLYECPDFFELPLDGDANTRKWVLMAANGEYAVGSFDGTTFLPEQSRLPGHRGRGYYAPQTFSDLPARDGRRIQIGWLQTETRGMPFNQSMSIPMELRLASTPAGPRITFTPVRELHALRTRSVAVAARTVRPGDPNPIANFDAELVEVALGFEPATNAVVELTVRGARIAYDGATQTLSVNGHSAPAPLVQGRQRWTVYADRTALEVFASDGHTFVPMPFQPAATNRSVALAVTGGETRLQFLQAHELRGAWNPRHARDRAPAGSPP